MRNEYDKKFKEMIVKKYRSGEKVTKLANDYTLKTGTIYKWASDSSSNDEVSENIDYEKEYKKLLREKTIFLVKWRH